ncbi:MAG: sugar kinase [Pelagibaca sp.]|nr:sugar kinase [Pelagibaca sp.]
MTRLRLAAAGDNCIDRFLTRKIARVGGNGLNVAVNFALAGHGSAYFGAVGDDADGRWTRAELKARGVDVDHLEIRPEPTAYTDIAHTPEGDRRFLFEEFGASGAYFPSDEAVETLGTMQHLHLGLLHGSELLVAFLAGGGVTISVDCAVNPLPLPVDLAFGSVGEDLAAALSELDRLLAIGHRLVIVTRGADGAIASDGQSSWSVAGKPIRPVDTTGAGDSFIAGFIACWKETGDVAAALDAGTERAAETCMTLGGFAQDGRAL